MKSEYNLNELEIVEVEKGWTRSLVWVVCVKAQSKSLVPLKLYRAEVYPQLSKTKIIDEKGKANFYPQEWFLPVKFAKKVTNVLEKVA